LYGTALQAIKLILNINPVGLVRQLTDDRVEVTGSNPACPTLIIKMLRKCGVFFSDWSALLECPFGYFIKFPEAIFPHLFNNFTSINIIF
jgi:hypothetical protein